MTDQLVIALTFVIVIALTTAVAPRLGIAGPLALVAIGAGVSLLPFMHIDPIDPEIILVGVLPPLLYSAAVSLPAIEFRRDLRPIAGLSVLLVLVSAVALGLFFFWAIPDLGLALSIGLGAILSPTDAVATTIAKRLGISPRVITIVEGESLLNDATALVLLRTAVAAFAAGAVSWGAAIGSFAWGVFLALIIGGLVGYLNLLVRERVSHSAANTAISFVVPFVAYLPTEHLGGSGLVASVVAGIVTGQGAARRFTPEQRLSDELNWRTIELMLEGAVFLLMGLELKEIVAANMSAERGLGHGLALAGVAFLILVAVRALYVTVLIALQGRSSRRAEAHGRDRLDHFAERVEHAAAQPPGGSASALGRRLPSDPERREKWVGVARRRISRTVADLDYYRASPLGWRHGSIIVWSGMRGVVTLAAAQTLPADAPHRHLLVLTAFLVAAGSLLLQGTTLPRVARMLKLTSEAPAGPSAAEERAIDDELRAAASRELVGDDTTIVRRDGSPFPDGLVERVGARFTTPPDDDTSMLGRDLIELRLAMIGVMRRRLLELSSEGSYSTLALRHALAELDADEISIQLRLGDRA
ncbi:Sodium, potassium, lithium and rubidium/H(+) antiporter [Microbacterium lemovicicum]|uniref:Sodium, potassium, lithium and rubidium/H(+) antiporter n=1 Tax=Microbacterium lemovicicum TaxID=1072463 RepID=A0A3S9W668_9MICO|nr:sodium:proton antiporter [Microbacterium lemovicicum]AZS35582.1 Sodium, potassium, lithium and rubidium/H(+) antiporter [Microbacterium lemovicicum]